MEKTSFLKECLLDGSSRITVLTGAGISAESGIPTFRGPEGYWTLGSRVYTPQEIATFAMFLKYPEEVWKWYLYRRSVCQGATPNAGHLALVEMEHRLGNRFSLVTQNIDNLHIRAGNTLEHTFQIHGNINFSRCSAACRRTLYPVAEDFHHMRCPNCGSWLRPHVLFFDETYDEQYFFFDSCLSIAAKTDVLITVGTTGATNLPVQVAMTVARNDKTIIDINVEANTFSELARSSRAGTFIQESSAEALPRLAELCV